MKRDSKVLLARFQSLLALALMVTALSLASDQFLALSNLRNILLQISINLCLSIGMTLIILSGGIDLSVGSVLALAGAVAAGLLKSGLTLPRFGVVIQFTVFGAILGGIVVGLVLGWFNGFVITRFKLPPFVATLGMLSVARGLTMLWTGGFPITRLGDRFGHKLSLELGALASLAAFALAWQAPSAEWYFAVFALLGITLASIIVSGILVVMEFGEPSRRPTYVGMVNTGVGLVGLAAPLLGAGLADVDYELLFALSAVLNLAALVLMRWWVKEPRFVRPAVALPDAGHSGPTAVPTIARLFVRQLHCRVPRHSSPTAVPTMLQLRCQQHLKYATPL